MYRSIVTYLYVTYVKAIQHKMITVLYPVFQRELGSDSERAFRVFIPVVPHKAVAEVSKIGKL